MIKYLLFLYLLFVNFWNIKPFGNFSVDIQLMAIVAYLIFGCIKYRRRSRISFVGKYNYMKWIFIGILLSMLPAYLFYGQPILQSLITYRTQYLIVTIPTLFIISPRLEEVVKSLFLFSFILLGANLLIKFNYNLFVLKASTIDRISISINENELSRVEGIEYITIPLFYYLQQIKDRFNTKSFLKVLFLLFVIFIVENRSTLFPAIVFTLYTFVFIKSKYKPIIWTVIFVIGVFFAIENLDVFTSLIEQTTEELGDQDYNRNKAWSYFLYMFSPHWSCYILGNGFLSAHYSPIMQLLMKEGIYNSDVGFIGYWNQFGIIPIFVFLVMYIKTLRNNSFPYFLKCMSLFALMGSLTLSYYGQCVHIFYFMLFYYLYYFYKSKQNLIKSLTR